MTSSFPCSIAYLWAILIALCVWLISAGSSCISTGVTPDRERYCVSGLCQAAHCWGDSQLRSALCASYSDAVMDCPAYLILSFLFCLSLPFLSVTLGHFALAYLLI